MKLKLFAALSGLFCAIGPLGLGAVVPAVAVGPIQVAQADPALFNELMDEGSDLYRRNCAGCHGSEGEGTNGPVLAENDLLSSRSGTLGIIISGNENHGMPAWGPVMDDREIAAVATYIRNSWGNSFGVVEEGAVAIRR